MTQASHVHVFYTDRANGWCVTALDKSDNQIGEGEYTYRKADAISTAKRHGLPIYVFGRNGLFQRQILNKTNAALEVDYRWEKTKQLKTSNEARVHVYHSYRQGCWVVTVFDENGYPSGTDELVDRKPLAIDMAKSHGLPVMIFARGGLFQRQISNKTNKGKTQETFAEMARRHRAADMLLAGNFNMVGGQACSVGCFCHDYGLEPADFEGLAKLTGYPEAAHRLQEAIFEGLPEAERADWHVAFAEKAATVTDWETVIDRTVLASLRIAEPHDKSESKVVAAVIALYERRLSGDNPSEADWDSAGAAGAAGVAGAAWAAWAAADAAWAARVAGAAWAAARAAEAAADAADAAAGDAWVKIRNAFLNA
jgi:hypothetical protein